MNTLERCLIAVMSCLLLAPLPVLGETVNIKDGRISVDIKDASLAGIARDIEKQSGILFKGDESLLEEKISVSFKDLPLEQGIKRILANVNYSLIFDSRGEVSEVKIMSEGSDTGVSQPQFRPGQTRPGTPSPAGRRPVVRRPTPSSPAAGSGSRAPAVRTPSGAGRTVPQRPVRPGPQTVEESNLPEALRTPESPPSRGVSSDEALPPAFRAVEREPAEQRAKETPETPDASKVRKRVPPAQGAAESSGDKPPEEEGEK